MPETTQAPQGQEFWRWKENNWQASEVDWRAAEIISCGIDVGSVSTQAVVFADDKLFAFASRRTGNNSPESAQRALDWALENTDMTLDDIHFTVGTGYGRVNIPFADKAVTEIACHARGANFIYGPTIRTLLDMGGQDCKAIHLDERGKVTNFLMNDKCAAGTGRGMEVFADLLQLPIEDVGKLSFQVDAEPPPVSSTCVVFGKSEALGLLRSGWTKEKVLASYCRAMAKRVVELIVRIGVEPSFAITGGISKNVGIVQRIEDELDVQSLKPTSDYDPQIAGALGAALFGNALERKQRRQGLN